MMCRLLVPVILLTLALPSVAHTQESSPPAATSIGLATMLARAPAELPELEDPERATIAYANIAAQLDAVGVVAPNNIDDARFDQWIAATAELPLPSHAAQYLQFWREDYGFDLLQADETLQISLPPYDLSLYRGRFNEREVLRTLRKRGYGAFEIQGETALSIRGDYEQDLGTSTAYRFAAMNYAAILDDGTLAFASARAPLEAVMEVAAGDRRSLAEQRDVASLLSEAPPDLAAALLVHGSALAGGVSIESMLIDVGPDATPDPEAMATEMAEQGRMPPVVLALLGATAGGPVQLTGDAVTPPPDTPDARAVAMLLMLSPEAAETAATVVAERLETESSIVTQEPYDAYFPERSVQAVAETPVVLIDLSLGEEIPRNVLMQMLFSRDLGFLAW